MSRKISLREAIDFCTRSSDEDSDFECEDEPEIDGDEMRDDKLSENEDEPLTSESEEESGDEVPDDIEPVRNREFHGRKQKYAVSSIETSLDESNYNMTDYDDIEVEEIEVPLEKKKQTVTKKITWTTEKPNQRIRQNQQNVIPNRPGVKPIFRDIVDPLLAWSSFIDDNIIQTIVTYTNQSINESIRLSKQDRGSDKLCHLIKTNEREMKAFIGLWYICGLLNWTFHDITTAYSSVYGHKIFNATMSIKRFRFLCSNIRFDDITTRADRFKHDRAAAVRMVFESFVENCENAMVPDSYLSLDETLYPTRVGVAFRQYNKSKPAKYGLLFRSINSAEMPYTYTSILYAGKPTGEPNEYYISSTDDIVKYLVTSLIDQVNMQGRSISCDRYYTSIELANWLLDKKMTITGTIKTNRKGVGDLKKMDGRENNRTKTYWEKEKGNMTMTSYVVNTKSSGKRNVLMLATTDPILGITKDDGKSKPAIIKFYDFTKGVKTSWTKRWETEVVKVDCCSIFVHP